MAGCRATRIRNIDAGFLPLSRVPGRSRSGPFPVSSRTAFVSAGGPSDREKQANGPIPCSLHKTRSNLFLPNRDRRAIIVLDIVD